VSNDVSIVYNISEYFKDIEFWYPPEVGLGKNPELMPEFDIALDGNITSETSQIKCVLVEKNGKNICTYPYLYLLETKNENGEWVSVGYTSEFFERNFGEFYKTFFVNHSENEYPYTRNSIVIYAKYHGMDTFPIGEYRLTRKVACLVNGENYCQDVVLEFSITE